MHGSHAEVQLFLSEKEDATINRLQTTSVKKVMMAILELLNVVEVITNKASSIKWSLSADKWIELIS